MNWERAMVRVALRLGMVLFAAVAITPLVVHAQEALSCGAPPPAEPERIKGGESFPPLPLPATPLRRTERKRPPAAPLLIAKLKYGEKRQAVAPDGRLYTYLDWRSDPGDAQQLLRFAGPKLDINYRVDVVDEHQFEPDPSKTPILYITGHQGFSFRPELADIIRQYVIAGGTLLGDACCGSGPFIDAFTDLAKKLFPNRRLAPLPSDHPLFHAFFDIDTVAFQDGVKVVKNDTPEILAVELGCRAAVLFWRYDMSCGWDGHVHDAGHRIEPSDAVRLGTNILAYCLANHELGRAFSAQKDYYEEDAVSATDAFVFGQLIHEGDWDPDPSAVANLLKAINRNSAIHVRFVRKNVDAMSTDLFNVPFLYMTGHHEFRFSEQEVQNLRAYLLDGGFLLADACCGRTAFDTAFRREMARVLPDRALEAIPAEDALYSALYPVKRVTLTRTGDSAPRLEGVRVEGLYAVVYSRDDLGNGWEGIEHPYVNDICQEDSLRLAMNVVMYALTH
ncbi:MAG TPA: DUF4159 domain-containing protein [Candidatus Hydrogenedentes bacterium]|nr:DUF4159 domain-containing protein [Candidatus Hydrogenedentota bacterium]